MPYWRSTGRVATGAFSVPVVRQQGTLQTLPIRYANDFRASWGLPLQAGDPGVELHPIQDLAALADAYAAPVADVGVPGRSVSVEADSVG